MVVTNLVHQAAQKESTKAAIIKRLKDAGATDAQMPASLEIDSDEAQDALAELLASGKVRQARSGLYYLAEGQGKRTEPGRLFLALLIMLVVTSFFATAVALGMLAG